MVTEPADPPDPPDPAPPAIKPTPTPTPVPALPPLPAGPTYILERRGGGGAETEKYCTHL